MTNKPAIIRTSIRYKVRSVAREALASAIAAPIVSSLVIAMIAGMSAAVVLASGQSITAERGVIQSIDTAGTRSIVIESQPGANFDTTLLDRVANLNAVEWAGALHFISDAHNAAIPDGAAVSHFQVWATSWRGTNLPSPSPQSSQIAFASTQAMSDLRIVDNIGTVTTTSGAQYSIVGPFRLPASLASLGSCLVTPVSHPRTPARVEQLIVVARSTEQVQPVAQIINSYLTPAQRTKTTITTSKQLVALRQLISGQLGSFGRSLSIGVLLITGSLAASVLAMSVAQRRKDFGRRRALGATRELILAILLIATLVLAAAVAPSVLSATA